MSPGRAVGTIDRPPPGSGVGEKKIEICGTANAAVEQHHNAPSGPVTLSVRCADAVLTAMIVQSPGEDGSLFWICDTRKMHTERTGLVFWQRVC